MDFKLGLPYCTFLRRTLERTILARTNCISDTLQNVFVITNYTGLDPEIAANAPTAGNPGIDNNLYPRPRVFALGLNLGF